MSPSKDPILASILSLLIPGLGQIYCREYSRGSFFLGGAFLVSFFVPPIGALFSFVIWVWSVIDAYRTAKGIQGYSGGAEGPVIDLKKFQFPSINVRPALPYIGIPLFIVVLLAVMVTIVLIRRGLFQEETTSSFIKPLVGKIESYRAETGSYPSSLRMLIDPIDPIEKKQIQDPWGNPLIYKSSVSNFELLSVGKDGLRGTKDDLPLYP